MGFDCYNLDDPGAYFRANIWWWPRLLELCREHGWEPAGTTLPRGDEGPGGWDGGYVTNDGQVVSAADALAMAAAAGLALEAGHCGGHPPDLVREFATFCRAGAFAIW